MYSLFQVCWPPLLSCHSLFLFASLLAFHMPLTPDQLLLSFRCFKLFAYQLTINDNSQPAVTQCSLFQPCCTSTCHQQSLLTSFYSVFLVSILQHFNLPSTIITNQVLHCFPCCKFVPLFDQVVNKNVKNIFLSMRDVKVSLTFTSLSLVLF